MKEDADKITPRREVGMNFQGSQNQFSLIHMLHGVLQSSVTIISPYEPKTMPVSTNPPVLFSSLRSAAAEESGGLLYFIKHWTLRWNELIYFCKSLPALQGLIQSNIKGNGAPLYYFGLNLELLGQSDRKVWSRPSNHKANYHTGSIRDNIWFTNANKR